MKYEIPYHHYEIEYMKQSPSSLLLFARHATTSQSVVMKVLRQYKDTRYGLETVEERQRCQLEALRLNRTFTPKVYIGLVKVHKLDIFQGYLSAGQVIQKPVFKRLDTDAEYALIMEELPQNRRLDNLLDPRDELSLRHHTRLLTEYVAYMHRHLVTSIPAENGLRWGSYEQLQEKLMHNLGLLDLVLVAGESGRFRTGNWSGEMHEQLQETLGRLKKAVIWAFMQSRYHDYFEQRVKEQRIKCCHGDLKSTNIWILTPDQRGAGEHCVKILDAIDFNPTYSNIDTLSDFAMLVVDVQTRTGSALLADEMIEYYLSLTEQESEVAKSVLDYYLVEKTIVGAALSIVYDDAQDLGLSLLKVAEMRLNCLIGRRH